MTQIGASAQDVPNFRTHLGQPMGWRRFYVTGATEPAWASATFDPVRAADALGESVCISFKTAAANWAAVSSGSRDAFLDQLAAGLSTLTKSGIVVYHHEPENDTATYGTSAQFRAAMTHVVNRMRPAVPATWKFYNCYMDDAFNSTSGRNADDWYVPELDGIGGDFYNWAPNNTTPPWAAANPAVVDPRVIFRNENGNRPAFPQDDIRNYAASKGKPYAIMEFACAIRSPGGATQEAERTTFMTALANYVLANPDPNFIAIMAFNFNAGESGAVYNFAIDRDSGVGFAPATIAQFARIDDGIGTVSSGSIDLAGWAAVA